MMHRLQENVEHERRISMDSYLRVVGKTFEELREEARPTAEQRVRADLVLEAVADAEQVEVPETEVEAQVRQVASSATLSSKEKRRLLTSEELRRRITRRLRKSYTINQLLELTKTPSDETTTDGTGAAAEESVPEHDTSAAQSALPGEDAVPVGVEAPTDQHTEEEN